MLIIQIECVDITGAIVAIHNIPGEGDVSAVLVSYLKIADMIVQGSCIAT